MKIIKTRDFFLQEIKQIVSNDTEQLKGSTREISQLRTRLFTGLYTVRVSLLNVFTLYLSYYERTSQ